MEKYKQIAVNLTKRIVTGVYAPGSRIPSEKELAEFYGVSVQTVNKAMSILVSDVTLNRKAGYGAFVDKGVDLDRLKDVTEFRIGILVDDSVSRITAADRVLARMTFNLQHQLTQDGFLWTVIGRGDGMDFRDHLPGLDGMVLIGGAEEADLKEIRDSGVPCVAYNRDYRSYGISSVLVSESVVFEMVEHMVSAGCTRFLYVVNDAEKEIYDLRNDQYRRAVESCGFAAVRINIPETELAERRISSETLTAIRGGDVAYLPNDGLAIALIQSLEESGIHVPDDLAVIGFDNSIAGRHSSVPLSTIAYDVLEACAAIVDKLHALVFDGAEPDLWELDAWLILRESSDRRKGVSP